MVEALEVRPLRSKTARLILAGLVFSIGGDTLLMLVENGPRDENAGNHELVMG